MLMGFLESQLDESVASQSCIEKSLARVSPFYHQQRLCCTERQRNPVPYSAEYRGHKLQDDQNEKLVIYGVTHVCSMNAYSRHVPAYSCMSIKNNFVI